MVEQNAIYVVHSCSSASYSGLERYVVDLAKWQHQAGYKVLMFCRMNSPIYLECQKSGIATWTIGEKEKLGPILSMKIGAFWRHLKQEALHSGQQLILHMHHSGELRFHRPWFQNINRRILQFHLWINHRKRNPYHSWLYAGLHEVWCSSTSARSHLHSILPVAESKIRVIPYGRPVATLKSINKTEARKSIRSLLKIPESDIVFCCVSRMEPIKGIQELFDAFSVLLRDYRNIHLLLVGGPSPQNAEAEEFYLGLQDQIDGLPSYGKGKVILTGFVPTATSYLAASDVYVLPSYEECMSLALLDALIMGLPTVGTNTGGTPAVVIPDKTGILVPPQDVESLKNALEMMLKFPEKRKNWGEQALETAEGLDENEVFNKIIQAYQSVF